MKEISWIQFNKKGEQVAKTKMVKEDKVENFLEKLSNNDDVYRILGIR